MMIYRFLITGGMLLLGGLAFASQASAGDYNVIACHASNDISKSNAFTYFQNGSGWTNNGQGDCMGALNMIYVGRTNNSVIPVQSWTAGSAGFTAVGVWGGKPTDLSVGCRTPAAKLSL